MDYAQIAILILSTIILIRAILKLPKKLAIGFLLVMFVSLAAMVIMVVYYPDELIRLASYINVELEV